MIDKENKTILWLELQLKKWWVERMSENNVYKKPSLERVGTLAEMTGKGDGPYPNGNSGTFGNFGQGNASR
jgi:hypothetical protein